MKYLTASALFFGAIFLVLWLVDYPQRMKGPSTGESCVAFVNRVYGQGPSGTAAEKRDLELCRHAHD